jgi:uncharacterized phage infection (PIP) family protein YhgE
VGWAQPETLGEALDGIGNGEYYGAIVIPEDYTEKLTGLASPPEIPIAVVNEDQGAEMNGQPVKFGEAVTDRITSPAPDFVRWTRLDDSDEAGKGLESGEYYAAIVIPEQPPGRCTDLSSS